MSKLEMIQEQILEAENRKDWKRAAALSRAWTEELKEEDKRLNQHLRNLDEKIKNTTRIMQQRHSSERRVASPWKFF